MNVPVYHVTTTFLFRRLVLAVLISIALLIGALYLSISDSVRFLVDGPSFAASVLGLVTLLSGVITVFAVVGSWRTRGISWLGRVHASLAALSAVALLIELMYWNLLGFS